MRDSVAAIARLIAEALARLRLPATQIDGQLAGTQVAPAASGSPGVVDRDDLVALSAATPQPLGTPAAGAAGAASDAGHIHAMPSAANVGAVPTGRTLTIDGVAHDLSADRTWTTSGGMADPTTTEGDLLYRGPISVTRLGIGSAGQVLRVASGVPAWVTLAWAMLTSTPTTLSGYGITDALGTANRSSATPAALGAAAAGSSGDVSRADHVHAMPSAANVGAEPALGNPGTTGYVLSSTTGGVRSWVAPGGGGGGAGAFTDLSDAPASYSGQGGKTVSVKGDETGLEFVSGGGGGAPTDAPYITAAASSDLSAEIVIPSLAASADRAGVGGAGFSEEFDDATTVFTWSSAPAVVDYDTTVPSAAYIKAAGTTDYVGWRSWSPAGDFDIRWKVHLGGSGNAIHVVRPLIMNSDNSVMAGFNLVFNNSVAYWQAAGVTFSGSYAYASGAVQNYGYGSCFYCRITRVGSTLTWWVSGDGILWTGSCGQQSFAITVARAGIGLIANGSGAECYAALDWMRADV
jgi:hypothetical protein